MRVKQLPSLTNRTPPARAWVATYSWPLRMTCAPNGGCPDILIVMCPHCGSMMVHDVEGVVVDEGPFLGQVDQHPASRAGDLTDRGDRAGHQDQEHPAVHGVLGEVLLGDLVLAFPALAVDHRDAVRAGRGPDPAGEPAGHPHQVRVVQLLVVAVQPSPPGAERMSRVPWNFGGGP